MSRSGTRASTAGAVAIASQSEREQVSSLQPLRPCPTKMAAPPPSLEPPDLAPRYLALTSYAASTHIYDKMSPCKPPQSRKFPPSAIKSLLLRTITVQVKVRWTWEALQAVEEPVVVGMAADPEPDDDVALE